VSGPPRLSRPARRSRAGAAGLALALAASLLAPAAQSATAPSGPTVSISRPAPKAGNYSVVVALAAPAAAESVSVFVGSQADRNIPLTPGTALNLAFELRLPHKRFVVRTVSTGTAVGFTVSMARQPAYPAPPPASRGGGGATGATGATGSTGTTPAPIISPQAGPYKHLVWSDAFNGPAGAPPDSQKWTEDTYGGCGDGTLSTNTQSTANASLDGSGHLSLTADGPPTYDSAQLDSSNSFSFEYGELEARIRIPSGSGLCAAFWMLGDSTSPGPCWPQCGEIDVMEAISLYPYDVFATLHGPTSGSANFQQWQSQLTAATTAFTDAYHTYGVIWRPGLITWTFDGAPYATATPSQLPPGAQWVFEGHPFHLVLDLAVGGWPGTPAAGAPFPATMSVDWVRLYN
jgi:hypothetical protein